MLYSLGYNIPNTRKINFERCEVGSEIFCDALGDVTLLRYADDFIETTINDEKKTYIFFVTLRHKTVITMLSQFFVVSDSNCEI